MFRRRKLLPLDNRGPLRVMFVLTSMPVGGAETLLVEIVRRMDRARFAPELCCLKRLGVLGELLSRQIPAHAGLLRHKYDLRVLPRLVRLMRQRQIDAVITVGPGDKMFWGRLAARLAGVPVVCAALHSTGYPDRVERLNRLLAPLTDAFIAVANSHGRFLAEHEGCPQHKVRVIPNGIDAERFRPIPPDESLRASVGILPGQPVLGIVAALRPEKNHDLLFQAAALVRRQLPDMQLLVVGDGTRRAELETMAAALGFQVVRADRCANNSQPAMPGSAADDHETRSGDESVLVVSEVGQHAFSANGYLQPTSTPYGGCCAAGVMRQSATIRFLGTRTDVPELLALMDVVVLTSHMEANPLCLLEAMACQKPVVATRVGSVPEVVSHGVTGYLVEPGNAPQIAQALVELLSSPQKAAEMGRAGREHVLRHATIQRTVEGYQQLLLELYSRKSAAPGA